MKSPKVNVQTETPAEVAAREVEQQRAEATQIQQTQGMNAAATVRRTRRFGKLFGGSQGLSNFASVSTPNNLGLDSIAKIGTGGFSFPPGTFNGSFG